MQFLVFSEKTIGPIQQFCKQCQFYVSEQRLSEVKYRDDELNRSLEANKIETEAAVEMRARVDKMIENLQELLHISQQCLVKRSVSACDNCS